MSNKLTEFVTKLSQDAEMLQEFRAFKEKTMAAFGLSIEEQQLVLAGDLNALSTQCGDCQVPQRPIFTYHIQ